MSLLKEDRIGTTLPARSFFYHYRREAKKLKQKVLSNGDYRKFIMEYHQLIADECINNKFEYKPPCRLGTFRIAKKKNLFLLDENGEIDKRYVVIDWAKTKAIWAKYPEKKGKKFIFFDNKHTAGYYFRWEWSRATAFFHNMDYYIFYPVIYNKKKLNKKIITTENFDAYEGVRKYY